MIAASDSVSQHRLDDLDLRARLERAGIATRTTKRRIRHFPWSKRRAMFSKLDYIPSPTQRAFHQSESRFKVLAAGARFGKSLCAAYEVVDLVLQPESHGWIVGPSYDLAEKEWAYLESALERLGIIELATVHRRSYPAYIEFPWGAKVWMRSADRPASLLGEELDWLILSEASQLGERVWTRYLRARLGSRQGCLIVPTTPHGLGLVQDLWREGQIQKEMGASGVTLSWESTVESWQCSVLENPHFPVTEYLEAARTMPPEDFAEQWDGRFVEGAGRIYSTFLPRRHVWTGDLPTRLQHAPVFRTIDFGWENPTAVLWVVLDREGDADNGVAPWTFWVVAELYQRHLLTTDGPAYKDFGVRPGLATLIKEHEWSKGKRVQFTIGDLADAQARAQLSANGVPVSDDVCRVHDGKQVSVTKAVEAGVRSVRELFHIGRIRIHESCTNTIREHLNYRSEDGHKDRPALDQDDHTCDALRYLLHSIAPSTSVTYTA